MTLYILHGIVARVGLEIAVILAVTGLLTVILALRGRSRRVPVRLFALSVWLPGLLAIALTVLGIAETWRMVALLTQREALSPEQFQLMFRSAIWFSLRCLAVGAAATFWLRLLNRRQWIRENSGTGVSTTTKPRN